MNKIFITGRLTKDPEMRSTGNGIEVASFTVAVDRKMSKEKTTDFFDCVAWRQSAAFVTKYFHKGDGINIEGRMESEKWEDKEHNKRTSWKVQVENMEFPHGKKSGATTAFTPEEEPADIPF